MNSTKLKLNVRLLRRIEVHILEQPKRFLMSCAVIKADTPDQWRAKVEMYNADASKIRPPCGTAACIAGWADLLTGGDGEGGVEVRERAATVLGVEPGTSWVGHSLFYAQSWPEPFRQQYRRATLPSKRAKVAAARIEHLIKTGE